MRYTTLKARAAEYTREELGWNKAVAARGSQSDTPRGSGSGRPPGSVHRLLQPRGFSHWRTS